MLNAAAVVIGIDRYDRPGVPALPGCVSDALLATNWLLSIGVPADRISVHIGPDQAQPTFPVPTKAADIRTVQSALHALKGGSGDQLFLFISGHGKYVAGAGPVFCCQDYNVEQDETRENLQIEAFIYWFCSLNYRDQFLFYDACQDDAASFDQISRLVPMGPRDPVGTYRPIASNAFTACFACSPGQTAWAGDGRGVLIRYALEKLDLSSWQTLDRDAPEQDAVDYNWATGERVIDLRKLFPQNIAPQITRAAADAGKSQAPFCQSFGRALSEDAAPILKLSPWPAASVTVRLEPPTVVYDLMWIKLKSDVVPRPCVLQNPLTIPAILKFPQDDQVRASGGLAPNSPWEPVKSPVLEKLNGLDANVTLEFRPILQPRANDGRGEINIVVDGGAGALPEVTKQLPQLQRKLGRSFSNVVVEHTARGTSIQFDPKDMESVNAAKSLGADWLKAFRRISHPGGASVVLSPPDHPRNIVPNALFDFDGGSAADIAGYLADFECVTIDSLSGDMPPHVASLRDLERHPMDWFEPGQCRISVELPWGRWTSRFRVGARGRITRVTLPRSIGLDPLRNRYRRGETDGPRLLALDENAGSSFWTASAIVDGGTSWVLGTVPVPILVLFAASGPRVEPFSETTLPEWDQLLTAGRLDIDDAAGLVKRLEGKLPGGTAEDFRFFGIAAAYAELAKHNWAGLQEILELVGRNDKNAVDFDLLGVAAALGEGMTLDPSQTEALTRIVPKVAMSPNARWPLFRWGVPLLIELAAHANLPIPDWTVALGSSSVLTLLDGSRIAALHAPSQAALAQSHAEQRLLESLDPLKPATSRVLSPGAGKEKPEESEKRAIKTDVKRPRGSEA
jgi:hypothetical protein